VHSAASDLPAPSSPLLPSLLPILVFHGSPDLGAGPFPVALVLGELAIARGVGDQRAADAGWWRPALGVDGPVIGVQGAQPHAGLRRELHPSARARIQRPRKSHTLKFPISRCE
jgi:hypothetical protein